MVRAVVAVAALLGALAVFPASALAQWQGPLSRWSATGCRTSRVSFAVGGGFPSVFGELDLAVNDRLALGLRAGYLYGAPHAGIRLAEGALIEIPLRTRLLARPGLELSLEATAGVAVGTDGRLSTLHDGFAGQVSAIAPTVEVALLGTWLVAPGLALKFGVDVPAVLVIATVDRPLDDALELTVALAPSLGLAWQATPWMSLFVAVRAGPALAWVPVGWSSERYDREVRVEPHLRAFGGLAFTPWR